MFKAHVDGNKTEKTPCASAFLKSCERHTTLVMGVTPLEPGVQGDTSVMERLALEVGGDHCCV